MVWQADRFQRSAGNRGRARFGVVLATPQYCRPEHDRRGIEDVGGFTHDNRVEGDVYGRADVGPGRGGARQGVRRPEHMTWRAGNPTRTVKSSLWM